MTYVKWKPVTRLNDTKVFVTVPVSSSKSFIHVSTNKTRGTQLLSGCRSSHGVNGTTGIGVACIAIRVIAIIHHYVRTISFLICCRMLLQISILGLLFVKLCYKGQNANSSYFAAICHGKQFSKELFKCTSTRRIATLL